VSELAADGSRGGDVPGLKLAAAYYRWRAIRDRHRTRALSANALFDAHRDDPSSAIVLG